LQTNTQDPVREFLDSYWEAKREEKRMRRRLAELSARCEKMTQNISGMPRGGGGDSSSAWDALIEAKIAADEQLKYWLRLEKEIESFIDSLSERTHRELLRYRYLESLKWETIGDLMSYNPDYVRMRLHGQALNAAREKWKEREEQNA
jgi:DNA-directed RNA polymerase specialized sigma24 family protein